MKNRKYQRILTVVVFCLSITLLAGSASATVVADRPHDTTASISQELTQAPLQKAAPTPTSQESIQASPEQVNTATATTAAQLLELERLLSPTYYLEARVHTLQDYNTFDPQGGYFTFSNSSDVPHSICYQLPGKDRREISRLSTYQAYQYVQQTDTYKTNAAFRAQVDKSYEQFMGFAPPVVRESLRGFVSSAVLSQLDPDQLCVMGEMIIGTELYQNLKTALGSVTDYHDVDQITVAHSAAEITLMHDEIMQAALAIWPQGSEELGFTVTTDPNGKTVLMTPLPTSFANQ